ncbi:MAG TPA: methyltransferase domain-containing protein [Candidatus Acidoferrales bacterium]|nr:methyltransferase domain-containing protein [Candidatus Acidoferrales bacterium]
MKKADDDPPLCELKKATNGIMYIDPAGPERPETIRCEGKTYSRFMDFIYISKSAEELSEDEVLAVNKLREQFIQKMPHWEINISVRAKFLRVIDSLVINSVLEIGPDSNPLFPDSGHKFKEYFTADLDLESVDLLSSKGIKSFHFNLNAPLPLPDSSIDLVVALFVFQFPISIQQIKEIRRVVKPDGAVMANVYRRDQRSRDELRAQFLEVGLHCKVIPDGSHLCRDHEYWCLSVNEDSNLLRVVIEGMTNNDREK